jgi:rubredoxin
MDRYRCSICSYTYDPKDGDPQYPVPPGVPFEKLPDDWACPMCGAEKALFEKVNE